MRASLRRNLMVALSIMVMIATIVPANAAENNANSGVLAQVKFAGNSYIELAGINEWSQNNRNIVAFTVGVYNGGNEELSFLDYWIRVKTKAGLRYQVKQFGLEQSSDIIPSKTKQFYHFYTTVNTTTKLDELIIEFVGWDSVALDYSNVLGVLTVPKGYQGVTAFGKALNLILNNTTVSASVSSMQVKKDSEGTEASIQFLLQNTGVQGVQIPDYKFFIKSDEGYMYVATPDKAEGQKMLQPKEKYILKLSAEIPANVGLKNPKLVMGIQDATAKMDLPLGTFELKEMTVQDDEIKPTPYQTEKSLTISNQAVAVSVKDAYLTKDQRNETNQISLTVKFKNNGKQPVTLPKYIYILKTAEDIYYPMNSGQQNDAELQINPKTAKEFQLTAVVPMSVKVNGSQVVLRQPAADTSPEQTLAIFNLPANMQTKIGNVIKKNETYTYKNEHGTYLIKLTSMQRLPWNDEDIISAEVEVANGGNTPLPIPDLSAYFKLDGIEVGKNATNLKKLDNIIALGAKQKTKFAIYVKIPYTYEYDQVNLALLENKSSDGGGGASNSTTADIVEINVASHELRISLVDKLKIENIGKRAEFNIAAVHTYTQNGSKLLYVQAVMENQEKRPTTLTKLAGFLRTSDDIYYPLQIMEVNKAVSPKGKVLLSLYAVVPGTVQTGDLKLIIGEEEKNGDSTAAMIKAYAMNLPLENDQPADKFEQIQIAPYEIEITNVKGLLLGTPQITFDYELTKNMEYEAVPPGHKLAIEFADGDVTYTQSFELEKDLLLGRHDGSMQINVPDLFSKIGTLDNFKINIYDEFENHRKLLATSSYSWF